MARFCSTCGQPTVPDARFCGKCGASLPEIQDSAFEAPAKAIGPLSLFDTSREYYMIKRQWWGWGSGTIHDERGAVIGHLHRRLLTIRDTTEFREVDDVTISAIIHRKIIAIRDTMDIKDGNEQMIGRVKQKILTLFRPEVWMEDTRGKKVLRAKGNFLGFSFDVYDRKGKLVAEIDKADKWRDIFVGGSVFDFTNMYGIVIRDPDADRRLIVTLAIAIDEVVHEDRKGRR